MFCPKCGNPLTGNEEFCPKCGYQNLVKPIENSKKLLEKKCIFLLF